MKRTTFTVLYFIKRAKLLKGGEAPIYCRVTVNGARFEFATKRTVLPEDWNTAKGCAKNVIRYKETNHYLEQIRYKMFECQRELEKQNKKVNAETLKKAYLGKYEEDKYLLGLYEAHNKEMESLIGKDVVERTYIRHQTSMNHLRKFMMLKYKIKDIAVNEINPKFIRDYEVYLKIDRNCNHNTTVKYIKNFKKVVNIALANGWIHSDPFKAIRFKYEETETVFLNQKELEAIEKREFSIERLNQIRDVFLFCCYTGLAFVDVFELQRGDISKGVDGRNWINKRRHKTGTKFCLPIIEKGQCILDKYEDNPMCVKNGVILPVISNQKMN